MQPEADDDGMLDKMADDSPQLTFRSFENNNNGFSPKNAATEELDLRDPLLDDTYKGQYSYQSCPCHKLHQRVPE